MILVDDFALWTWLRQYWRCLSQRAMCGTTARHFARLAAEWSIGVITGAAVVDGVGKLTVMQTKGRGSAAVGEPGGWIVDEWISGRAGVPTTYDVCIDMDPHDERKTIRLRIDSNTERVLTVADFSERLVDLSEVVGRKCYIVTSYSPWWNERSLLGPNDRWLVRGVATAGGATTLTLAGAGWTVNQWVGMKLVVKDRGRVLVVSNTVDTLSFAAKSWSVAAGDEFVITGPARVFDFGRTGEIFPYRWYAGYSEIWPTHDARVVPANVGPASPDGGAQMSVEAHKTSFTYPGGAVVNAMDLDIWSDVIDFVAISDKCWTPEITRTLRGLQTAVENLCTAFVEPVDHTGRKNLESWTLVGHMAYIGVNVITGIIGEWNAGTGYTQLAGIADFGEDAKDVPYVLFKDDKAELLGTASLLDDGRIQAKFGDLGTEWVGYTLTIWLGWTRRKPRWVKYFYPKTAFIPDVFGVTIFDPPINDEGKVGSWYQKQPSTSYATHDERGVVIVNGTDSHDQFVEGERARYVGDNWGDPTLVGGDGLAAYRNNLYTGTEYPGFKHGDSGTATNGGEYWIEDESKAWWPHGELIKHEGVITAVAGNTVSDATKVGDWFWKTAGRLEGFCMEVVGGPRAGVRVPIIGHVAGITLSLAVEGAIQAGDAYKIIEPRYVRNHWQGRTIRITRLDGTSVEVVCTHSDDQRLYFARQAVGMTAGMSYSIIDPPTGTVWKREGGQWVVPTAGMSYEQQQAIEPTIVQRYGRVMKWDYLGVHHFQELKVAINAMRWQLAGGAWAKDEPDEADTINYHGTKHTVSQADYATAVAYDLDRWNDWADWPVDINHDYINPPMAGAMLAFDLSVPDYQVNSERGWQRAFITPAYVLWDDSTYSVPVDFYNYARAYGYDDGALDEAAEEAAWDANGSPVLLKQWKKWSEDVLSHVDGTPTFSAPLGGIGDGTEVIAAEAHPNAPAMPATPPDVGNAYRGFEVTGVKTVLKYDQGFLDFLE